MLVSRRLAHFAALGGLALALAVATACDDPLSERGLPVCDPGVALSVSQESTPTFAWSPRCRAAVLSLTGEQGAFWSVIGGDNRLVSPIRYGDEPRGALSIGFADPLTAGVTYRAVLQRASVPFAFDTVADVSFRR